MGEGKESKPDKVYTGGAVWKVGLTSLAIIVALITFIVGQLKGQVSVTEAQINLSALISTAQKDIKDLRADFNYLQLESATDRAVMKERLKTIDEKVSDTHTKVEQILDRGD